MKIYVIRHGESTGDLDNKYGGTYDDELSTTGMQQARALGKELSNQGIQRIYHSPYRRAKQTATTLNQALHVPLKEKYELREIDRYSFLSGMIKTEAKRKHPEEVARIDKGLFEDEVSGSEPVSHFRSRVKQAHQDIVTRSTNEHCIAIVSHGGFGNMLAQVLTGKSYDFGDCGWVCLDSDSNVVDTKRIESAT